MTSRSRDANLRWLGLVVATLAAVPIALFGTATASAASAPTAQTRLEARTHQTPIVIEPHDGIGAGQRLESSHSTYFSALAIGVPGEDRVATAPMLALEYRYDGAAPIYDASVRFFGARTVAQVESVGIHATSVSVPRRFGAVSHRSVSVSRYGVAADSEAGASNTLFHYTTEEGQKGILDSEQLNPSLKSVNPSDARYGNGQYLSDIAPGSKTGAQLSRSFLNNPFQAARFSNYVEIDTSGLNVVQGRAGVFVVPGETPLDLTGRIISWGAN
jgi:HYD1 signature containing ADP-ribosyltransferase